MLLFMTNFLAILFAGGLVFLISGLGRLSMGKAEEHVRVAAFALIIAAGVLITIPLAFTSYTTVSDANDTRKATQVVRDWLGATPARIVSLQVHGSSVSVTVAGQVESLNTRQLANNLAAMLGRPLQVDLRAVPARFDLVPGTSP